MLRVLNPPPFTAGAWDWPRRNSHIPHTNTHTHAHKHASWNVRYMDSEDEKPGGKSTFSTW